MSKKQKSVSIPHKTEQAATAARPKWLLYGVAAAALVLIVVVIWLAQGRQQTTVTPAQPGVTGQPSAVIDQTEFDYGDVKLNTTIETVFRVKNEGDQPLVFQGNPEVKVVEGC